MSAEATGVRAAQPGRDSVALAGLRWAWAVEKGLAGEVRSADGSGPAAAGGLAVPPSEFVASFATWVAANAGSHSAFLALTSDPGPGAGQVVGRAGEGAPVGEWSAGEGPTAEGPTAEGPMAEGPTVEGPTAERPVGMAWLATVERPPDLGRPIRRAGLVQSVFVLPEHRNGGVGGVLMEALVEAARSRALDYLLVSPSERSVPFYRRLGFSGDHRLALPLT